MIIGENFFEGLQVAFGVTTVWNDVRRPAKLRVVLANSDTNSHPECYESNDPSEA